MRFPAAQHDEEEVMARLLARVPITDPSSLRRLRSDPAAAAAGGEKGELRGLGRFAEPAEPPSYHGPSQSVPITG